MRIATVIHPPVFGSAVKSLNAEKVLAMPGVEKVMVIETGIAIVAKTFWQVIEAKDMLEFTLQAKKSSREPDRCLMKSRTCALSL